MKLLIRAACLIVLVCVVCGEASADAVVGKALDYQLDSGRHNGTPGWVVAVFSDVVSVQGAAWLGLSLEFVSLGVEDFIEVTSLEDGDTQVLHAGQITGGRLRSAQFNGSNVQVTLYVGPQSLQSGFVVTRVWVGFPEDPEEAIRGATADDRVLSNDSRVCSFLWERSDGQLRGCTAFLIQGQPSCMATVGHCLFNASFGPPVAATVHCNVYGCGIGTCTSNVCSGGPRDGLYCVPGTIGTIGEVVTGTIAAVDDQYDVPIPGPLGHDAGADDHAVFIPDVSMGNNRTVFQNQGSFFQVTTTDPAPGASMRVTGHGIDTDTPANSRLQQTATGPFEQRIEFIVFHAAFREAGNSGSPVIKNSGSQADTAYAIDSGTWMGYDHVQADIATLCPEPSTALLQGGAVAVLCVMVRRKARRATTRE